MVVLLGTLSCNKESALKEEPFSLDIPDYFPKPHIPGDSKMTLKRIELGKALFFDPILSRDSSMSCAGCHFAENAMADPKEFSPGVDGIVQDRHTPVLFNLAWHSKFFADGGSPSLEVQALAPISNKTEMDLFLNVAIERLNSSVKYKLKFNEAFGSEPDVFGLTRALAIFQRTLLSVNSDFDRFFYQGETNAISADAKRGWAIFQKPELNCMACHAPPLFSTYKFENNGFSFGKDDQGRYRITGDSTDMYKFKVPSLRNTEVSAPFMHDALFADLSSVIDAYAASNSHPGKSDKLKPFNISTQEKSDLIAFFESLTDLSALPEKP